MRGSVSETFVLIALRFAQEGKGELRVICRLSGSVDNPAAESACGVWTWPTSTSTCAKH